MIMSTDNPQPKLCEQSNRALWNDFQWTYYLKYRVGPNPEFWTEEDVVYWMDHQYTVDDDLSDAII